MTGPVRGTLQASTKTAICHAMCTNAATVLALSEAREVIDEGNSVEAREAALSQPPVA